MLNKVVIKENKRKITIVNQLVMNKWKIRENKNKM